MAAYVHDSGYATRRTIVFFGIVAAHILLIYAFATGLVQRAVNMVAPPIDVSMIEEKKVKDELPPPPPPAQLERPPVQVVAPEINIAVPVDAPPPPITNVTTKPVITLPPPPPPPTTAAQPTFFPNSDDYYPSLSRQNDEEGRAEIKICITATGKLESVDLMKGSGFQRLDDAAVSMGKASRWKPATQGGKPVPYCKGYGITFKLTRK